jgi:hypothetical protein
MTPARGVLLSAFALASATVLAACGGSGHTGVATGPEQTAGPASTPPATPTPTATATVAAGPSPTPSATPSPQPSPAPASTSAGIIPSGDPYGAAKLGAYLYPSNPGIACGGRTGHYDACPVTSRLAARLDSHPTQPAEALCRCENTWQQSSVSVTQTPDPTVWIDHVVLTFGPGVSVTIDVRVLRTSGGWLGDDTTCTGQGEQTSIYAPNPPPCPGQ